MDRERNHTHHTKTIGRLFAMVAVAAAACQGGTLPDAPASETRDSAGVRIVDNARPADDARLPWRIGPDPVVSIGEVTGDESYMLHRANDAATLPDGRIVVANTGTNELRVFDAAGVYLTTWGRAGEGPGEFTALAGVATWPGDSIAAWDARSRVISIFDSGGTLGRTFFLESDDRPDEPRLVLGDGTVLGSASRGSGEGYTRAEVTYELRDGRGGVQLSFGDHPGQESFMSTAGPFPTFGFLPFGRTLSEAAWGDLFVIAPNDLYEIRAYDRSDGSLARIVRRDYANRAPTRAEVDEAIDDALARTNLSGQQLEWTRDGYTAMPLVESFPAFRVLLTDDLDHLWVREATLPGMERPAPLWTVFDTEGRALGFIETPADLTILEIGSDYLLGQTTDDLGVETVQVWPLEREPDPGATGRAATADLFSPWPGDESFRIAAEPSLVVGSDESLPLARVSGAVFFGDGIAIADGQSYEVLILDAAGRLLAGRWPGHLEVCTNLSGEVPVDLVVPGNRRNPFRDPVDVEGVVPALTQEGAPVVCQVSQQVAALHAVTVMGSLMTGPPPASSRAISRLASITRATASRRFVRASSREAPWVLAPGNSSMKAM